MHIYHKSAPPLFTCPDGRTICAPPEDIPAHTSRSPSLLGKFQFIALFKLAGLTARAPRRGAMKLPRQRELAKIGSSEPIFD